MIKSFIDSPISSKKLQVKKEISRGFYSVLGG